MIKKDTLSKKIDSLIELEESLIPLLNKHIASSLSFSNLKDSDRTTVLEYFKRLAIAQTKHVNILHEVKKELQRGKSDVY
jgi:hypothetical protein